MNSPKSQLGQAEIKQLHQLFCSERSHMQFLSYDANIESFEIVDGLNNDILIKDRRAQTLWTLLLHFSKSEPRERSGKLVNFRGLPGGHAYDNAFMRRAVQPISEAFGKEPHRLIEAGKKLSGNTKRFGDASIEVAALPTVPLVYILWEKGEFPASANILFDKTASSFLPTEDLAILAEITTSRLQEADRMNHAKSLENINILKDDHATI